MERKLTIPIGMLLLYTLLCLNSLAQEIKTITGTVSDEKGTTLPGATVKTKDNKQGTQTDVNGRFTIKVPASTKVLVFSFVGMQDNEVAVTKNEISVTMTLLSSSTANDVIVVGYGTVKKKDLTGAVSRVDGEVLNKTVPTEVVSALQGRVAGVAVTQNDGAPGSGMSMRIRGSNSFLGGTEPLYVIDGVPFNNSAANATPKSLGDDENQSVNPLNFLSPADIESIDVLKDASATAIYGSRGANGVVIITTRKGKQGNDKVDLTATTGVAHVAKKLKVLNAYQYATYTNLAYTNAQINEGATEEIPYPGAYRDTGYYPGPDDYKGKGTDWQDVLFRSALTQNYTLNVSGGTSAGSHSFSFSYLNQDGTIVNSNFRRYGVNFNLHRNVGKFIKIGTSGALSQSITNGVKTSTSSSDDANAGVVRAALTYPSTQDLNSNLSSVFFITNPLIYARDVLNRVTSKNVYSSNYAEVSFLKYFKFKQTLGFNYAYNVRDQYYPRTVYEGKSKKGWGLKSYDQWGNFMSESLLSYSQQIKQHNISAVAAGTYERTDGQWMRYDAAGFPNDDNKNENLGAGESQQTLAAPYNNRYTTKYVSFLTRVNYSYMGRYLLTASLRRDGASQFGEGHKWGNFPSFSAAWKLNEEDFIKKLNVFSDLKLRAGYGQVGSVSLPAYASLDKLTTANYPLGGSVATGYANDYYSGPANPNLKWETTRSVNLGVDFGFFNNRLTATIDVYRKKTVDLLQSITIPLSTGYSSMYVNSGSIQNKGLEITIQGDVIRKKNFTWNTNFNIAFNRNKILSLGSDTTLKQQFAGNISTNYAPYIQKPGHAIGELYGYVENGYYDNEAEVRADPAYASQGDAIIRRTVGEIKYAHPNGGSGALTTSDRTFIGNVNPKYTFGFTNNVSYKNWDVSLFISGSIGNDIINLTSYFLTRNVGYQNVLEDMYYNSWTAGKDNSKAKYPKIEKQSWRTYYFSRRFIEDGSYVRIKNLQVGYTLPKNLIKNVSNIRLAVSANNLYTFTHYSGYDPEMNGFGTDPAKYGVDLGGYPVSRTYNVSLRCNF